ncbi:MAG TPA: toprim domain-containing protein [Candidatus Thermoplasmatota archaeon]|jgi:5S rRNA maturation endonuclease (ribonuclease M5)|nr:toprim domain-containing protein [Candidatus Thermoplasmatota archaeon]
MTSTTAQDRLDEIEALLDDLIADNAEWPVLVEGEKDVASLRALGLEGEILRIKGATTVWVACEAIARRHRKVILMVDWDRGGGHLARLVLDALEANGVRCDPDYRRALARASKKEIVHVEGLATYMDNLRRAARREHEPSAGPPPS